MRSGLLLLSTIVVCAALAANIGAQPAPGSISTREFLVFGPSQIDQAGNCGDSGEHDQQNLRRQSWRGRKQVSLRHVPSRRRVHGFCDCARRARQRLYHRDDDVESRLRAEGEYGRLGDRVHASSAVRIGSRAVQFSRMRRGTRSSREALRRGIFRFLRVSCKSNSRARRTRLSPSSIRALGLNTSDS